MITPPTHDRPVITCALGGTISDGEQFVRDALAKITLPPNMECKVAEGHPLRIDEDPSLISPSCVVATLMAWWPDANYPYTTFIINDGMATRDGASRRWFDNTEHDGIHYNGRVSYSYCTVVIDQLIWDNCAGDPTIINIMMWSAAEELWNHELREMFKVDGKFFKTPHRPDGGFNWS